MTRRGAYKAREARALTARHFFIEAGARPGKRWLEQPWRRRKRRSGRKWPWRASLALRRTMVDCQLRPFDVTDVPILQRFLDMPREIFLPDDSPAARLFRSGDFAQGRRGVRRARCCRRCTSRASCKAPTSARRHRVLDIAGGAGYPAALLSGLAAKVVALESDPELAAKSKANLAAIGAANVRVETGAAGKGLSRRRPLRRHH